MRLLDVSKLLEMAGPPQTCATCNTSPKAPNHNYIKGTWYCRQANIAAYKAAGGNPQVGPSGKYEFVQAGAQAAAPAAPGTPPAPSVVRTAPAARPAPAAPTPPAPPARPHKEQAEEWIAKNKIEGATVNGDDTVDVNGDVTFMKLLHAQLPVRFSHVTGDFTVTSGMVNTLENLPVNVDGNVYLANLKATSLEGLTPSIGGDLTILGCPLTTLAVGTPIEVQGDLTLSVGPTLKSLEGINKTFKRVNGKVTIEGEVAECAVGLLGIRGVKEIAMDWSNKKVAEILNKQLLNGERDINQAQEDLIEAGLGAWARTSSKKAA